MSTTTTASAGAGDAGAAEFGEARGATAGALDGTHDLARALDVARDQQQPETGGGRLELRQQREQQLLFGRLAGGAAMGAAADEDARDSSSAHSRRSRARRSGATAVASASCFRLPVTAMRSCATPIARSRAAYSSFCAQKWSTCANCGRIRSSSR